MNWRERTAQILGNGAGVELTKPPKALLSVLSVPPPALSGDDAEVTALVNQVADANAFTDEDRAEALELALRNPGPWLENPGAWLRKAIQRARTRTPLSMHPAGTHACSLSDPERPEGYKQADIDARCRYVLAMLERDPTLTRATKVYDSVDPDNVIIATAKRGSWYAELVAPKPIDPYAFMSMTVPDEVH